MKKNKRSEDATIKVGTPKVKETTEVGVVSLLMDIFDESFNNGNFDDTVLARVQTGEGFGCAPSEMELSLKDGSIFTISVRKVRGPK